MTEQKHTPGPWIVATELRQDDEIICDMLNEQGYVVITKGQKLANWRDDAKLIAAAPKMLAALIKLHDSLKQLNDCGDVGQMVADYVDIAQAAIAEATQ